MLHSGNMVSAQDLADALDLTLHTIMKYTHQGKIPFIKLNGHYKYDLAAVITALTGLSIREESPKYNSDPNKLYTYQDYLEIPDEPGYRYEILNGVLIREPSAPSVLHQWISQNLSRALADYFQDYDPGGLVFSAPLDVTFQETTVVQPDILYISSGQRDIVKATRIDGAPMLAIEVLSPSTRNKDRIVKLQIYQRAGVQHYWLVDPDAQTVQAFCLKEDTYSLAAVGHTDQELIHPDFPGLAIKLASLWALPASQE